MSSNVSPSSSSYTRSGPLKSTVLDLPNRIRDQQRVWDTLGLSEFPSWNPEDEQPSIFLRSDHEGLLAEVHLGAAAQSSSTRKLVSNTGYRRIVFGDHGPYLEFTEEQVCLASFPHVSKKPAHAFYDEYWHFGARFLTRVFRHDMREYVDDAAAFWTKIDETVHASEKHSSGSTPAANTGSSRSPEPAKDYAYLYAQKRSVRSKPNPPHTGKWWCDNERYEDGYADYQPGYFYLECSADTVVVEWPQGQRSSRTIHDQDDHGPTRSPDSPGKGRDADQEGHSPAPASKSSKRNKWKKK
ncbi:unnamed protein product [Amoebophrya sp. A25]|nr:unnamed protein product [Amoebophrya sp. A25]|eukprot:GSA25T00003169001.1